MRTFLFTDLTITVCFKDNVPGSKEKNGPIKQGWENIQLQNKTDRFRKSASVLVKRIPQTQRVRVNDVLTNYIHPPQWRFQNSVAYLKWSFLQLESRSPFDLSSVDNNGVTWRHFRSKKRHEKYEICTYYLIQDIKG